MEDFTGLRFGNVHTKDLGLVVVSSSDRYNKNLLPDNKDYSVEVPGGDGSYYFGQTHGTREFSCDVAFDNVDEKTWRRIAQLFATNKLQDLVFDELPYKTYRAKLKSKPEFKYICFLDRDTNQRVYKGEGTLNFVCYFPYAFGFNKYIIRAADKYDLNPSPNVPDYPSLEDHPYEKKKQRIYNTDTKDFYNVKNNMKTPWKGGYPTIEQVQAGELYFNAPDGEQKIIDVRRYFRNVPHWAESSKLLVTPTLDYDQDLIYLPQYSKTTNINMDIGLTQDNALIGSRLLVYNPGDLPIDFELKLGRITRTLNTNRANHFQVRRFNVQRMPIPMAVDLTGLKTVNETENESYKYGNRYFKTHMITANENEDGEVKYHIELQNLGDKHPEHAFIAEPIPSEKLGHFIRMFYWQSSKTAGLDFEEGVARADRYEELYELCIDDCERWELYWTTLKEAILDKWQDAEIFSEEDNPYANIKGFDNVPSFKDFIYDYIHNPPEFIRKDSELHYGQFDFNLTTYPQWFTEDYLEIKTEGIENETLFLDSEKRMLYNIINPEYTKGNEESYSNFYKYKPSKKIYNDNIVRGHWFKLPPGWSLIEVAPVCEINDWGGKKWSDARPFDWGYGDYINKNAEHTGNITEIQDLFNYTYEQVISKKYVSIENIQFRHMFDDLLLELSKKDENNNLIDKFGYELVQNRMVDLEYKFLKQLQEEWRYQCLTNPGIATGSVQEWWWYACNYIWEHFPPLYWAYADILNNAQIKYTPLFY